MRKTIAVGFRFIVRSIICAAICLPGAAACGHRRAQDATARHAGATLESVSGVAFVSDQAADFTETSSETFVLEPGDLLFQDLDCGAMCDAIEGVTQGVDGARLSHVAMVVEGGEHPTAIEAYANGVALISVHVLMKRSADSQGHAKVLVGRLKPQYRHLIKAAVQSAEKRLGMPYDEAFLLNNNAYYCSELLYDAFLEANNGRPVFELAPMTYRLPGKNEFAPVWKQHFEAGGQTIPEGKPGLNPGGMSRSNVLQIIHYYGRPQRNPNR